jgi:hypothetical protein
MLVVVMYVCLGYEAETLCQRVEKLASFRASRYALLVMAQRTHTKLKGALDYDDAEFWDTRFATGADVGEWLNSGEVLLEAVLADLGKRPSVTVEKVPRVLQLGPGVSKLGSTLRDKCVERGWQGNGIVVRPIH